MADTISLTVYSAPKRRAIRRKERSLTPAKGAENNLLRILGRTYDELVIMGEGTFPEELMVAGLMLVDVLYQHRSPQEAVKLSDVAYTFEFYTKPFMKL